MSEIYEKWVEETGGDAFPCLDGEGMTLRDWFAGNIASGIVASFSHPDATGMANKDDSENVASTAYSVADALIKARGMKNENG